MIDYDATLSKFFDEALKFLDKRANKAKDKKELEKILSAKRNVECIAKNPKKYADYNARVKAGLTDTAYGFVPNGGNNNVYLVYERVLQLMGDLDSDFDYHREHAQKILLDALKAIKYYNASNMLKDLYYPFISPTKFAVKDKTK